MNISTRQKIRDTIIKTKDNKPCMDCGIVFRYWVLQYDHLRDKVNNVSAMARSHGLKKVLEEIEKCDLICANCHANRTHERQAAVVERFTR